jgi:hypothetical protein
MQDPIRKITKAKSAGGVASVIKCLHSKNKALSSNPSTAPTEGIIYFRLLILSTEKAQNFSSFLSLEVLFSKTLLLIFFKEYQQFSPLRYVYIFIFFLNIYFKQRIFLQLS